MYLKAAAKFALQYAPHAVVPRLLALVRREAARQVVRLASRKPVVPVVRSNGPPVPRGPAVRLPHAYGRLRVLTLPLLLSKILPLSEDGGQVPEHHRQHL